MRSPMIKTERLLIDQFTPADLDDFAALCADPVAFYVIARPA